MKYAKILKQEYAYNKSEKGMMMGMAVTCKNFGSTKEGQEVKLYTIENKNGMVVTVTNYGVNIVNVIVPDQNGKKEDVVLGYDTVEGYFTNGSFFGATIGPSANRIANASFMIDGVKYQLIANDGTNNLHSHEELGYHKALWNAEVQGENSVLFSMEDADGNMGFPGNKQVKVAITLTDANELKLAYHVSADKNTLINMTNHSYFNLAGHDAGQIENHKLYINASAYTPVDERLIPTGELASVEGTPFDFRELHLVGERINEENAQLKLGKGYDHNWVIDGCDGTIRKVAEVIEETSGRSMEVYTDQPGIQFYAGNCITPVGGKNGAFYGKRSGLCLETQVFPDSINEEKFPNSVFGPSKDYEAVTIYKFNW